MEAEFDQLVQEYEGQEFASTNVEEVKNRNRMDESQEEVTEGLEDELPKWNDEYKKAGIATKEGSAGSKN